MRKINAKIESTLTYILNFHVLGFLVFAKRIRTDSNLSVQVDLFIAWAVISRPPGIPNTITEYIVKRKKMQGFKSTVRA